MYYKGTKKECESYNNIVTIGENYQQSTNRWANVVRNENGQGFAILKHEDYETDMTLVHSLPDSWFNINPI